MDPNRKVIQNHKIIRYVDDTFLSLTFTKGLTTKKKKHFILELLNSLVERYYTELGLRFNKKFGLYFLNNEKDVKKLTTRLKYTSLVPVQEDGKELEGSSTSGNSNKVANGKRAVKAQIIAQTIVTSQKNGVKKKSKQEIDPKKKAKDLLKLLEKIKAKGIDFLYDSFAEKIEDYRDEVDEVLKYIYDSNVGNIFRSAKWKQELEDVLDGFPFEVFRLNSKAFTVLISKTSKAASKYRKFLLKSKEVTIFDAALIHDYVTQIDFNDQELLKKLMQNQQWKPFVSLYKKRLLSPAKDYCKVPRKKLSFFDDDINITEQIRLRRHHENLQEYTVALNHLLNEFHSICRALDSNAGSGKSYDVNKVVEFLGANKIGSQRRIGIRNLFDRRNKNPISHPGENKLAAWAVTPKEYLSYKKLVMDCLRSLILNFRQEEKKKTQ